MSETGRRPPTIFDGPPYAAAPPPAPVPAPAAAPVPAPTRTAGNRVPALLLAAVVVRALCTLAALVLVASVVGLVLQAERTEVFAALGRAADLLDLGVFDVEGGVVDFGGPRADLKDAMANRALAALVWLLLGWGLGRLLAGAAGTGERDSVTVR